MYYRVATRVDAAPTWQWKSTVLSSLNTLFQLATLSAISHCLDDLAGEGAAGHIAFLEIVSDLCRSLPCQASRSHERCRVEMEENQMRTLNEPTDKPIKHHKVVHGRMKDSFTSIFATILSIIQGVALADLATIVAVKYPQFSVVQWLTMVIIFRFSDKL